MLSVLLVDDEPPARRRLRRLLEAEPDVRVVGEADDVPSAVAAVRALAPDLVLLDVQLPGHDGFRVVEEVGAAAMPAVVFVTAYDAHALRAFDARALDYLLKPVDGDRLRAALGRARVFAARPAPAAGGGCASLGGRCAAAALLDRLPVTDGDRVRLVRASDIEYVEAEGNYARLYAEGRTYVVRETMAHLEARLDGGRFARVHRSLIVRIDAVREIAPQPQGECSLLLQSGARVSTGRTYRDAVRRAFGLRA